MSGPEIDPFFKAAEHVQVANEVVLGKDRISPSDVKKYLSMNILLNYSWGEAPEFILLCRLNWELREVKQKGCLRGCHKTGGNSYFFKSTLNSKSTIEVCQ